ncbi:hypothetical protein ARMGADRAFT_1083025 [Armillaria gallica]|uniref:Uncharacterized protein n=1 Tax=Armillaria gallica TaxID=47427 RepID=A0A2H3D4E4_ARMGA|nr:hypothetical protein ARMGADRAFT_1083025 [Armillaria gallica]
MDQERSTGDHTSVHEEGKRPNDSTGVATPHPEGEAPNPQIDASRLPDKAAGTKNNSRLVFKAKQSANHERIWDGRVVEVNEQANDGERDGEYSLDDLGSNAQTYNLDALLANQSISSTDRTDNRMSPT